MDLWKEKVKMQFSNKEVQDSTELNLMSKVIQKKSHPFGCHIFMDYDISREASLRLEPKEAGSSEELGSLSSRERTQRSIELKENV